MNDNKNLRRSPAKRNAHAQRGTMAHGAKRSSRRKKRNRFATPLMLGTLCALFVALASLFALHQISRADVPAMRLANIQVTLEPQSTPAPTVEPTAAPTPDPTAEPTAAPTEAPTPEPTPFEYLPVFTRAQTDARKIAVTVDDCYQVDNLEKIVKYAKQSGAKLTVFPVGENLTKHGMSSLLKECVFSLGFEIENHTWSHSRIFRMPESEMAAEIWKQSQALNQVLGVNYQQHFFRLMGGDGTNDQRTHSYLKQLGYKGIAEWSLSGSDAGMDLIKSHLSPGAIYLFHCTDADTEKLRTFIPWAVSQGYQLVTMNELLGFEDNAVSTLSAQEMPQPQQYTTDYHTHRKGDYAWIIVQMQDRLRQDGYLQMDGPSTGYYGDQTTAAVKAFQTAQGLNPTGEADEATQKMILGIQG